MSSTDPTVALIQAAAAQDGQPLAARVAQSSLEAAVDTWLGRVAGRTASAPERARLVRAVELGEATETKEVQLTRAALLRKAGLDERAAAAAAIAAGASYTVVGAVLGMTQQGASARFGPYVADQANS
ncbi:MAG: Fis family transcriptional regulator [Actinomycetia bacterium]|nr:Fis family transcriptional regulator [Actinomycetes bacterium]